MSSTKQLSLVLLAPLAILGAYFYWTTSSASKHMVEAEEGAEMGLEPEPAVREVAPRKSANLVAAKILPPEEEDEDPVESSPKKSADPSGGSQAGGPDAGPPKKHVAHSGKQELQGGVLSLYYPNSEILKERGPFQDSKRQGSWESFSETGFVTLRREFRDDQPEGMHEAWFDNGTMQVTGMKVGGQWQGQVTYWNADGAIDEDRSGMYEAGSKVVEPGTEGPVIDGPDQDAENPDSGNSGGEGDVLQGEGD